MHAEHIVGLTARERFSDTIAQAAAIRFAAIKADGVLRPYNADRPFELDHLAGDSACVFLSVGARYREYIEPDAAYGFVFDARHLILEHGAIVGVDMLQHYEDLLEQCIAEVAATLPRYGDSHWRHDGAGCARSGCIVQTARPGVAGYASMRR